MTTLWKRIDHASDRHNRTAAAKTEVKGVTLLAAFQMMVLLKSIVQRCNSSQQM
jgi:hypothetical protein